MKYDIWPRIILTIIIVYGLAFVLFGCGSASADIKCEYRTVTERSATGEITTTQKQTCIERTINGKSAPTVSRQYGNQSALAKKIRKPGCYKKAPDGYIVADPQCPAWIAYLREIDERNGLVPYTNRNHNRFKRDLFGAFLTVVFSK